MHTAAVVVGIVVVVVRVVFYANVNVAAPIV